MGQYSEQFFQAPNTILRKNYHVTTKQMYDTDCDKLYLFEVCICPEDVAFVKEEVVTLFL